VERTVGGRASVFTGKEIPFSAMEVTADCEGTSGRIAIKPSPAEVYVSGFVLDSDGAPIAGAAVTPPDRKISAVTDRYGFFSLQGAGTPTTLEVSKTGYRKAPVSITAGSYPSVELAGFYSTIEAGLTVTVDPQGGGAETGWVGPTGIAGSDLNLEVAGRVATALRSAGIETYLTRESDCEVGGAERVAACESNRSALLVSIAHMQASPEQVTIEHFPGSRGGILLSGYLAEEITGTTGYGTGIAETAEYIIQQTSCPAVKVTFPAGRTAEDEVRLSQTFDIWKRAYPIFCAVLRHLGVTEESTFTVSGSVISGGRRFGHAVVTIDGTMEVLADAKGHFTAKLLERVPHTAEAFSGGRKSAPVTFDNTTGPITLELPPP
jgi:hypothetical protein